MIQKITPLWSNVLVEITIKREDEVNGIIVLLDQNQQPTEGKVLKVAKGVKEVKVGDTVGFKSFSEIEVDKTQRIIDLNDLLYIKYDGVVPSKPRGVAMLGLEE